MREPSLSCGPAPEEAYRLLRLEDGGVPAVVTVSKLGEKYRARRVMLAPPGWMMPPGEIVEERSLEVSKSLYTSVLSALATSDFWNQATSDGTTRGTVWVIEGLRQGVHHVVVRHSPLPRGLDEAGLALLTLGGVSEAELAMGSGKFKPRQYQPKPFDPTNAPIEKPE